MVFLSFSLLQLDIVNQNYVSPENLDKQNAGIHYKYKISIKPIYIIIEKQKTNFTYIYNGGVK
jgi:hypothetical protein